MVKVLQIDGLNLVRKKRVKINWNRQVKMDIS